MKICSKCGVEKELNEFHNNSASTDGKRKECKECRKIGSKIYYHNNIDYYKQRRLDNPHYMKQYRLDNPEKTHINYSKQHSKRRGWGNPEPINKAFEGSHLHHLHIEDNHQVCVYIPVDLHTSVRHAYNNPETMVKINEIAMEWYYDNL